MPEMGMKTKYIFLIINYSCTLFCSCTASSAQTALVSSVFRTLLFSELSPALLKRHLSLFFCKDDTLIPSVRRGQWNKIFYKQQFRLVERSGAETDVHSDFPSPLKGTWHRSIAGVKEHCYMSPILVSGPYIHPAGKWGLIIASSCLSPLHSPCWFESVTCVHHPAPMWLHPYPTASPLGD